jgi:hypothetical protein
MSMDDGLEFGERNALVKSLTGKHRKIHNLPRFGPSIGGKNLLVLV